MRFFNMIRGLRRVSIPAAEHAIVTRNARVVDVLGPGEHDIPIADDVTRVPFNNPLVPLDPSDAVFAARPDFARAHFRTVQPGPQEVAVLGGPGRFWHMVMPLEAVTVLADVPDLSVQVIDIGRSRQLPREVADRVIRGQAQAGFVVVEVPHGHVGVVHDGDADPVQLGTGKHLFLRVGQAVNSRLVDIRQRSLDVRGQEILTRDRVSLRVTLSARFRVVDPLRAVTAVEDFAEALHRALQLAFRRRLGARSLDQLLADKGAVDDEAVGAVRSEMAQVGVEVHEVALKDVILPGDMRDILTSVVAAEKEAEANVIRRREEANAMRSLLNTAKAMADNPVLLRLKELEALETVAGKVGNLSVHNGTAGLLDDIVRLRDR